MIFPQLPEKYRDWSEAAQDIKELIDSVAEQYSIDTGRISLTGHSMGGSGTYAVACRYPELLSKIAPLSGSVKCTAENLAALKGRPLWALVGAKDTIVNPQYSIDFVNAINSAGGMAKITVFDEATHFDVPEYAYLDSKLNVIGWLIGSSEDAVDLGVTLNIENSGEYVLFFLLYDETGNLFDVNMERKYFEKGDNIIRRTQGKNLNTDAKIVLYSIKDEKICGTYKLR